MQINCTDATVQGLIIFALIRSEKLSGIHLQVQATTAIVEKTVRAFYSTIAVVSTIAVGCCMERI